MLLPAAALGAFVLRPGTAIHAQGAAPGKGPGSVRCIANTSQWLEEPRVAQLSNGVEFGQDDATLKTETVVALFDKDHHLVSAKAQGAVHIFDPQDDLVGLHGSVDFTRHLAMLQDNIVLIVKPGRREADANGSSLRRQFTDPATLTCQAMTYDYKFKVGRIPGPLTVTQVIQTKDGGPLTRTLTADAGLYNGKAETIQLVGSIRGFDSDGRVIEGNTRTLGKPLVINIREGFETLFAPFVTTGVFPVKPEKDGSGTDKDDEPDLTLPTPPAHTPTPGDSAPATLQAPPAAPAPTPQGAPGAAPLSAVPPAAGASPAPPAAGTP